MGNVNKKFQLNPIITSTDFYNVRMNNYKGQKTYLETFDATCED